MAIRLGKRGEYKGEVGNQKPEARTKRQTRNGKEGSGLHQRALAEESVEGRREEADDQEGEVGAVGDRDVELETGGEDADEQGVEDAGAAGHRAEGGGGGEEEGHEQQGAGHDLVV